MPRNVVEGAALELDEGASRLDGEVLRGRELASACSHEQDLPGARRMEWFREASARSQMLPACLAARDVVGQAG